MVTTGMVTVTFPSFLLLGLDRQAQEAKRRRLPAGTGAPVISPFTRLLAGWGEKEMKGMVTDRPVTLSLPDRPIDHSPW